MVSHAALRDEKKRISILKEYRILDTPSEEDFDDIVKLACQICHTPMALISLVDEKRVWFKAKVGIDINETERCISFCPHAMMQSDVMVVNDTLRDPRFHNNPFVTGDPSLRFYAGMPLINQGGYKLGTLCVMDTYAKKLDEQQLFSLRILAKQVVNLIEMRLRVGQLNHALVSLEKNKIALEKANTELMDVQEDSTTSLEQITELQKFLEQRERQYRELVDDASDMIYELGADGKFTFANPMMESITGYSKEQLINKYFWEIVHPEYRQDVIDFYQRQRKQLQETSYLETQIIRASGKVIWCGQNVRMFYKDNRVWKVSSVARDITQLKETEKKLEESENLYRLLSNNARDLISLHKTDDRATTTFLSLSSKEILGYEPDEMVGHSFFELIATEDHEKIIRDIYPDILKGIPVSTEYRVKRKDGTIVWLESNTQPFHDQHGVLIGFQGSSRDITQRKHFEHELITAKVKAEEATKAKSQFLSMMSHEIRTPMNAIIGLTNLMMTEAPRPDQMESFNLLKFSGENLLTIINDILDFSKIEAGKIDLECVSFNLSELLVHSCNLLQLRAKENGISIQTEFAASLPPTVLGDPVRISQIVNNLLSNAIKFTEKGYVKLKLESASNDDQIHTIKFTVKDTGIGIPADKIGYIFESFTQATGDTTRKFGGTGLGLTITKKLVQLMGGEITVKSILGVGSEFSFALDLKKGDKEKVYQHTYQPQGKSVTKHARILLAEDNRVNQIVASNFLKRWGMQVTFANDGYEATELIKSKEFDVILMDLQMPEMDGYEASMYIRALDDEYFRKIPIIALTASAMLEVKDKVLEAGMNDFITKPFLPEELQSKITKYLEEDSVTNLLKENRTALLDSYFDGDDEFKVELIGMVIKNIQELKESLDDTLHKHDPKIFSAAAHKCAASVSMLTDSGLGNSITKIKDILKSPQRVPLLVHMQFHKICDTCIADLKEEISNMKKSA